MFQLERDSSRTDDKFYANEVTKTKTNYFRFDEKSVLLLKQDICVIEAVEGKKEGLIQRQTYWLISIDQIIVKWLLWLNQVLI